MNNEKIENLGKNIFSILTSLNSVFLWNAENELTEEFGSYTREENSDQTHTIYNFKLKDSLVHITIISSPGFPDDWANDFQLEIMINGNLVLKGRILKDQQGQNQSEFRGIESESFVDGPWVEEIEQLSTLYKMQFEEGSKNSSKEHQEIAEQRIKNSLEKRKQNLL